jgi:folate-binding protein YgfZ
LRLKFPQLHCPTDGMQRLELHDFHQKLGARFTTINGAEAVADYGNAEAEHTALREAAGVLDLSFRSRLCLTGADRVRFLHGQATNDVKALVPGAGCYAALVTAKGRMESDLNIYYLADELLLDFEPGLVAVITQRLEKYIVADDVQVVDVASMYGLLSVQGPRSDAIVSSLGIFATVPKRSFDFVKADASGLGELYLMNQPRTGSAGFDLFFPIASMSSAIDKLIAAAQKHGGGPCGWTALESARIEAGIPRFGLDMDETNFPQECRIEERAISYNKGCYIGQEVINRIHTMGHVNKHLCGLRLAEALSNLPSKGDKIFHNGKEVGYITSALVSKPVNAKIALGYLRSEANQIGTELKLRAAEGDTLAHVVSLPFRAS